MSIQSKCAVRFATSGGEEFSFAGLIYNLNVRPRIHVGANETRECGLSSFYMQDRRSFDLESSNGYKFSFSFAAWITYFAKQDEVMLQRVIYVDVNVFNEQDTKICSLVLYADDPKSELVVDTSKSNCSKAIIESLRKLVSRRD